MIWGQDTLYVGFGGYHVAIQCDASEILVGLARGFREMLEPAPGQVIWQLTVHHRDGQYYFVGSDEIQVEHGSSTDAVRWARHEVASRLIQARPDLLWLHAGAAVHDGRALMILGSWGRGKSTLTTGLAARGWMYLSDDIVALDPADGAILPFPLTPMVREDPGEELPEHRLSELTKIEVVLDPATICRNRVLLGAVILPTYRLRAPTSIAACPPTMSALALLQSCMNLGLHHEAAFHYLANLAQHVPAFNISFNNRDLAAQLIASTLKGHASAYPDSRLWRGHVAAGEGLSDERASAAALSNGSTYHKLHR